MGKHKIMEQMLSLSTQIWANFKNNPSKGLTEPCSYDNIALNLGNINQRLIIQMINLCVVVVVVLSLLLVVINKEAFAAGSAT
jgi:hypothetical protein